ncbi:hypothetical protein SO802_035169 [Lithocarpus litseifolius]|uniref:Uncharacterized protein n=1 Tax=Lithocarpus litseifolius TaxID=425828 RepID=A0AAW2BBN7_9ROSI
MGKSPFPSLYSNHYEEGTGLIEDFRERFNPAIPGYLVTNNDSEKVLLYKTRKILVRQAMTEILASAEATVSAVRIGFLIIRIIQGHRNDAS